MSEPRADIVVQVERDIEDLVPAFLARRRTELDQIADDLARGEFERIAVIGHSMKGTCGAFGFIGLSEIGRRLEAAAHTESGHEISGILAEYRDHLGRIRVESV